MLQWAVYSRLLAALLARRPSPNSSEPKEPSGSSRPRCLLESELGRQALSSRIVSMLFQLHGYAFFHGPSTPGTTDKRFIGRVQLHKRLRLLLTHAESRSGAYLVTGYRGVGKTSLVGQVLSQIAMKPLTLPRARRYLRIIAPLFLLMAIADYKIQALSDVSLLGASLYLLIGMALLLHRIRREGVSSSKLNPALAALYRGRKLPSRLRQELKNRGFSAQMASLMRLLRLNSDDLPQRALYRAREEITLALLLYGSGALLSALSAEPETITIPLPFIHICWAVALLLSMVLFNIVYDWRHTASRRSYSLHQPKTEKRPFDSWLRDRAHGLSRIPVAINLGQDDLTEPDILRLIARKLQSSYKEFLHRSVLARLRQTLFVSAAILIAWELTQNAVFRAFNNAIVLRSQLVHYFPSQLPPAKEVSGLDFKAVPGHLSLLCKIYRDQHESTQGLEKLYEQIRGQYENYIESGAGQSSAQATEEDAFLARLTPFEPEKNVSIPRRIALRLATEFDALHLHLMHYLQDHGEQIVSTFPFAQQASPNRQAKNSCNSTRDHWHLHFLFIPYLIGAFLFLRLLERFIPFGVPHHGQLLRRLTHLNERVTTQFTLRSQESLGSSRPALPLLFQRSIQRVVPQATIREIEAELLEIVELISRTSFLLTRPSFVLVFDELDKIEPHQNLTISDEEADDSQPSEPISVFSSYEQTRERQHRILALLSNLKHFFTTIAAKSVFIAGREMLDASLADVSDRHFFMGSLFNEVLYVPSFLRDPSDGKLADATSMTERYVTSYLLPERLNREPTLEHYNRYLRAEVLCEDLLEDVEKEVARAIRVKAVTQVKSLVLYLTYRSNGAPKKLTSLFESYIERRHQLPADLGELIALGESENGVFLHLGYHDQLSHGLIAYLATPFFCCFNRDIKDFGDKLLVSGAFLLDHLYKFHGFGFSWRSLELLPELIDINRAPQLREVINRIVEFLSRTHITAIPSGLYELKFHRRIVEEIRYISRISEREGAAFNFTLDESLTVKRHYRRELQKMLAMKSGAAPRAGYVHSVGFLRMILGDLHYYDQEYDQAIVEYMEAVHALEDPPAEGQALSLRRLTLLVRNLLKLGLAFERKKTFDSAFTVYAKIATAVLQYRSGSTNGQASDVAEKSTALESLRLFTQPLLARIAITEKTTPGGATLAHIARYEAEIEILLDSLVDVESGWMLRHENWRKLADIFYFKNGPNQVTSSSRDAKALVSYPHCLSESEGNRRILVNSDYDALIKEGGHLPCVACRFYALTVERIFPYLFGKAATKDANIVLQILECLAAPREFVAPSGEAFALLSRTLSDLGDTFVSCFKVSPLVPHWPQVETMIGLVKDDADATGSISYVQGAPSLDNKGLEALLCYIVASFAANRATQPREASYQLTKFLYFLREWAGAAVPEKLAQENTLENLMNVVVYRIVRDIYRTYESAHQVEREDFSRLLDSVRSGNAPIARNLSLSMEVTEIAVTYWDLHRRLCTVAVGGQTDNTWPPAFAVVSSAFNRVHELRYRSEINAELVKMGRSVKEVEFLLCDSIFCLHTVTRTLAVYDPSYLAGHWQRAAAHYKLAQWCERMERYIVEEKAELVIDRTKAGASPQNDEQRRRAQRLELQLGRLIGRGDLGTLSWSFHYERALGHLRACEGTHREGPAYRDFINRMCFLNDDLSDPLIHFCAALERLRLNAGHAANLIKKIHGFLLEDTAYKIDSYAPWGNTETIATQD